MHGSIRLSHHRPGDQRDLPLATTVASALNSTTLILVKWADILRSVFPVVTSQRKTDRSPPEETNLVLSCALKQAIGRSCTDAFIIGADTLTQKLIELHNRGPRMP